MLVLFFTIVFLAELIVAGWIISKIKLADDCVCAVNAQIKGIQPQLKDSLQSVRETVNTLHAKLDCVIKTVTDKKNRCENIIKNKALAEFILWAAKLPYKKIISVLEIIFTIKKLLSYKSSNK